MIAATRPEPTVLPPSRFSVVEIGVILCDFQGFFGGFFFDMHLVSDVLGIAFNAFSNASPTQKTHLERIKNALKHINFYNT